MTALSRMWTCARACSTLVHAKRRTDELEMVRDTLKDVNIEPIMSSATMKALDKIAGLEFDKHFIGREPKNFMEALRAIRKIKLKQCAYEKVSYIVFSPIHKHTFTHSFIMKGVARAYGVNNSIGMLLCCGLVLVCLFCGLLWLLLG